LERGAMRVLRAEALKHRHVAHRGKPRAVGKAVAWGLLLAAVPAFAAPGLEEKFRIGRPQFHYLVLLDTSGSMAPFFDQVLQGVRALLQVLPPDDFLTVYRFDDYPVRLCHNHVKDLVLPEGCLPRGVNRDPRSRTEMGETLEKALDDIEASRASVFIVFFLTDGKEEPRRGSKFDRSHEESWAALAERGRRLSRQKEMWGYGLGLRRYTDVHLLARVIPPERVEVITMDNPSELRGRVEDLRERVRRNWLRSAVRKELEGGFLELVQVQAPTVRQGRVYATYAIRSAYPHLAVRPVSLAVGPSMPDLKLALEAPVSVPTGGRSQPFTVSFRLPSHSPWRLGRKTITREDRLIFQATPVLADEEEIRGLGLEPRVRLRGFETVVSYSYPAGIPFSFLALLPFSLLTFVLLAARWGRVPPPEVFGTLSDGGIPPVDLGRGHKRRVRIGGAGQDVDIELPGVVGAFEIEVRRRGSYDILFLRPLAGQIRLEGRTLSSFAEEELQRDGVRVAIDGREVILTGVSPRRVRRRAWGKILLLLAFLVVLNVLAWKAGP